MAEAATALLALWNDVAPEQAADYDAWHANEHVPQRLTVPGMQWALRYGRVAGAALPHYLTLYGLRDAAVLDSEPYKRLLREPTPTSARMRPALRNIARWVCVLHRFDGLGEQRFMALRTSASSQRATKAALLAERIPEGGSLPWLQGTQAAPIGGDWLTGSASDDAPAPVGGAAVYERLQRIFRAST